MKKWQEERNYRRVRSEAGEVIANSLLCSDPSNARLRVCGCCHRRWRVSLP